MRRLTRQTLSVLLAFAVVGTAAGGALVYDGPASPVQEAEAGAVTDTAVSVGIALGSVATCAVTDCLTGTQAANELAGLDAQETHQQMYYQAETMRQQADLQATAIQNNAEAGSSIARSEGKNAIIRSLDEGKSTAEAKTDGIDTSEDWYSRQQAELIKQNDIIVETVANQAARWESSNATGGTSNIFSQLTTDDWPTPNTTTAQVELLNGSKAEMKLLVLTTGATDAPLAGSGIPTQFSELKALDPDGNGEHHTIWYSSNSNKSLTASWEKLKNQEATTEQELDAFADRAYDAVQNGEISPQDLIDPTLQAEQYSPEDDTSTWAISTLRAAGAKTPLSLANTTVMNVSVNGSVKQGILMSDGLPSGNEFQLGQQYDPATLEGIQYLVTDDGTETINSPFTIQSRQLPDGSSDRNGSVAYETADWNTSSINGYAAKMDAYANRSAAINQRQQEIREGSDGLLGGLFGGGGGPSPIIIGVLALGGGYLLVRSREGNSGGVTINRIPDEIRRRRD
ncbi:hypothetical protein [Halorientalis litorea]|uniref:hypothetical protein n=1 Tax=Halorientalis litorea TaxID=2931977 RepID=UPI001FF45F98|nr:hypothetical protein [Halorientalis litorea]